MKLTRILLVFLVIFLSGGTLPAQGQMGTLHDPGGLAGWSAPTVIYAEAWPDPLRFSIDDSATRLVS